MKKCFFLLLAICSLCATSFAQTDTIAFYKKSEVMIPMRDGVKLHTVIFSPVGAKNPLPVLLERTPYGADPGFANDSAFSFSLFGNYYGMNHNHTLTLTITIH